MYEDVIITLEIHKKEVCQQIAELSNEKMAVDRRDRSAYDSFIARFNKDIKETNSAISWLEFISAAYNAGLNNEQIRKEIEKQCKSKP